MSTNIKFLKKTVIATSIIATAFMSGVVHAQVAQYGATPTANTVGYAPYDPNNTANIYNTPQTGSNVNMYSAPTATVNPYGTPQAGAPTGLPDDYYALQGNQAPQTVNSTGGAVQPAAGQQNQQTSSFSPPSTNPYGVPDDSLVKIDGKTIKYQHGKNSDPEQVIQQEQRTLNEKLLLATPQQIQDAQNRAYRTVQALNANPNPARCDKPRLIHASTDPNSPIPKVRLNSSGATNLVFTDATGKAWNISDLVWTENIDISYNKEASDVSRISITPTQLGASGNLTVELRDNPIPISIEYFSDQNVMDCTVQIRLDGISEENKKKMIKTEAYGAAPVESSDSELLSVVMGMKPEGGREMKTSDNAFRVWRMKDGTSLIRTRYHIVTPAPMSRTQNPDGTFVFRVKSDYTYMYKINDQYYTFTVTR